jgi:MFS family permease
MLATARDRFLLALQYRDYRTLWTANMCAGSAAWALIIARGWLAFELTDGSSLWVGLVTFGAMAPRFFATPIIGFLADRVDRKSLLAWTYFFNFSHNVVLALLVMTGFAGPWLLVVLALTNGTLRAGQMTTTQALIPNLLPKEHLLNAIALNQATQQGSRMVGALIIMPLLGFFSGNLELAFWFCSALYFLGMLQILRIETKSTGVIDRDRSFFENFLAGFQFVYQHPLLLAMILIVLAHCAFTMSYESMLPAVSQEKLSAGPVGVAYLLGGVGVGALFSSIFLAGIKSETNRGKLFLLFGLTSGIGPILLALSTNRELSIAATVAMGVNQAGFMTISHTIIQTIVPDWVRGRVSGVYSMHVGGSMALANLANGGFSDMFNASAVMAVGGALFLIAITLSVTSGALRGIYFPRPAAAVPA